MRCFIARAAKGIILTENVRLRRRTASDRPFPIGRSGFPAAAFYFAAAKPLPHPLYRVHSISQIIFFYL